MNNFIKVSFVNSDNVKVEVSAFKEPNNYVSLLIDINGTMISSLVPDIAYNEKSVLKAAKKIEKENRSQYKMFDYCIDNGIYDKYFQ